MSVAVGYFVAIEEEEEEQIHRQSIDRHYPPWSKVEVGTTRVTHE